MVITGRLVLLSIGVDLPMVILPGSGRDCICDTLVHYSIVSLWKC